MMPGPVLPAMARTLCLAAALALVLQPALACTGIIPRAEDGAAVPARTMRAVAFANTALPSADADAAVFRAFHILNAFDIPKGAIRESEELETLTDFTIWTSAADTRNARYYYKTYLSQGIERIDLPAALAGLDAPATLKMESGLTVTNRTGDF